MSGMANRTEKWVLEFLNGDEDAWPALWDHIQDRVRCLSQCWLNRIPQARCLAETGDVQNDANIRMDKNKEHLREFLGNGASPYARRFYVWCSNQIRLTVIDTLRGFGKFLDRKQPDPEIMDCSNIAPLDWLVVKEFHEELVPNLEPKLREVFELHYYYGLTFIVIAETLGKHERTVRKWYNKAQRELGQALPATKSTESQKPS